MTSESGRIDGTLVGRRNELAGLLAQAAEVRGGRLTQEEVSVAGLVAKGGGPTVRWRTSVGPWRQSRSDSGQPEVWT